MIGLDYFLFGYFFVHPKMEEKGVLLNLLLQKGITAQQRKGGCLIFKEKQRKILAPFLEKMDCTVSEMRGLPRFIIGNRKRYGFFAGLLLSLFLLLFSSTHIWDIRAFGADATLENAVVEALREQGIYSGASLRNVDFSEAENRLLRECPSLGWVSIYRRGTVLYASLIPRAQGDSDAPSSLGNIVASEGGVIVSVSPSAGDVCVKVGEAVEKGALLISAVHKDGTLSGAEGEVLACVSGQISAFCEKEESRTVVQRTKTVSIGIKIFDFSLNVFKNYGNLARECDIIESEEQLKLLGRYPIPVFLRRETAYESKEERVCYSDAEATALAAVRLRAALSELLSEGEMRSMRTEGAWQGERFVMTVYYEQVRSIGRLVPIAIGEEK